MHYTLNDVLFRMDYYHPEISAAFTGHPTLSCKKLVKIVYDNVPDEDGRDELILMLVDELGTNRQCFEVCKRIYNRVSYMSEDDYAPEMTREHLYHADNIITNCLNPSVYTVSDDCAMAVASFSGAEETDEKYWDIVEDENSSHINIIMDTLEVTR